MLGLFFFVDPFSEYKFTPSFPLIHILKYPFKAPESDFMRSVKTRIAKKTPWAIHKNPNREFCANRKRPYFTKNQSLEKSTCLRRLAGFCENAKNTLPRRVFDKLSKTTRVPLLVPAGPCRFYKQNGKQTTFNVVVFHFPKNRDCIPFVKNCGCLPFSAYPGL